MTTSALMQDGQHAALDASQAIAMGNSPQGIDTVNAFVAAHGDPGLARLYQVWAAAVHYLPRPANTEPSIPESLPALRAIFEQEGQQPTQEKLVQTYALMQVAEEQAHTVLAVVAAGRDAEAELAALVTFISGLPALDPKLTHNVTYWLLSEATVRLNGIPNGPGLDPSTHPGFTDWNRHMAGYR